MGDIVFRKDELVVTKKKKDRYGRTSFIVMNMLKQFEDGHTHLNSYKQAVYAVDCIKKNKIPYNVNIYFLVSLKRLSTDKQYIEKIDNLIDTRTRKGIKKPYINQGGRKR